MKARSNANAVIKLFRMPAAPSMSLLAKLLVQQLRSERFDAVEGEKQSVSSLRRVASAAQRRHGSCVTLEEPTTRLRRPALTLQEAPLAHLNWLS